MGVAGLHREREEKEMIVIYIDEEPKRKVLNKKVATSVICSREKLERSGKLKKVAESQDNMYYSIEDCNACIMHVEDDFCIIIDNLVNIYNEPNKKCSLPALLAAGHYAVYQTINSPGGNRDWIKNSGTSELIGYDIKNLIHGPGCKVAGTQLEHLSWTLDEREAHKIFGPNKARNSHRVKVEIETMEDLDWMIDKIVDSEKNNKEIDWRK